MKLVVFSNKEKFSAKLAKFFTGSYAFHVGWVDEEAKLLYDMKLIRRRRFWPRYEAPCTWTMFEFPEVTRDYLEFQLTNDSELYGFVDYFMFMLRPLYHLLGKTTRNAHGEICTEMVNRDLWNCGVKTPFKITDEPPSPGDMEAWLKTTGR